MAVGAEVFLFAFEYSCVFALDPLCCFWLNKRPNVGVCLSAAVMDGAYKDSQMAPRLLSLSVPPPLSPLKLVSSLQLSNPLR